VKNIWIILGSLFVFTIILSACGNNESSNDTEAETDTNSVEQDEPFVVATQLEPNNFVINYTWDGATPYLNRNIFSKLVAYDDYSGEIFGDLAEDWSYSEDLTEYTFNLRENVTWHDGEDFTSDDVKWTVESLIEEGDAANGFRSVNNVESVETPDDNTVTFNLTEPSGVFVEKLADYQGFDILPKHLYEDTDIENNEYNTAPIGTGPFKFDEHTSGSHVRLIANSDYYGDGPYINELIFQFVPSEETALTSLEAGNVQAMTASPAFGEVPRIEENESLGFDADPTGIVQWISFNMDETREHISDPVVREAIVTALDNVQIAETLYNNLVTPAESWYLSTIEWADNQSVRQPETDIDHANELLDDAGYERQDDGYRFSLTYRAFETSIYGTTEIPKFVQQQLEEIGINVDFEQYEWALRTEMLDERRDWDLAAGGGDRGPDPIFFESFLGTDSASNKMLYSNPEVDALFEEGEKTIEKEERAEHYHEIQEIIAEDIPLYNVVEYFIPRVYDSDYEGFHWQESSVNSTNHMFNSVKRN